VCVENLEIHVTPAWMDCARQYKIQHDRRVDFNVHRVRIVNQKGNEEKEN
jgi:hypothetical protein